MGLRRLSTSEVQVRRKISLFYYLGENRVYLASSYQGIERAFRYIMFRTVLCTNTIPVSLSRQQRQGGISHCPKRRDESKGGYAFCLFL